VLEPARALVASTVGDLAGLTGHPLIRCHGDLHVAQFVASPSGPVVIDFEGEPGLPLDRRRDPASPLRDVACLLLSLDHVAAAAARREGFGPALRRALGWSAAARAAAVDAYTSAASAAGLGVDAHLLLAWELEKELHEVLYAATVLPAWSYAPRIALAGLLERASDA
jgi:maltokinase